MLQKCMRYIPAVLCLLVCVAMPFMMLSVETQLETLFASVGQAPCTVSFVNNGRTITENSALLTLQDDMAVITTTGGEVVTVPARDIVRSPAPSSLLSRSTLFAVLATAAAAVLMLAMLIPLNAYLIQFSIEHTPDGGFHPFDAA